MRVSFSQRIFGAMFLVILFTSLSILFITIYHFGEQTKTYHEDRLKRKEERVLATIDYELDRYPETVTSMNIAEILRNKIHGISDVNNQKINLFSLEGELLLATASDEEERKIAIPDSVLQKLSVKNDRIEIPVITKEDITFLTTYSYVYNINRQAVAIANLPYYSNNSFFISEQNMLLKRFGVVMPFILIIGGVFAWVMSKQITRRLKVVANKIQNTQMMGDNEPITYLEKDEVKVLVDSYNEMVVKLKDQSQLLARKEREEAWREMAKQVAHEVKNPLTPMKLLIQNFERRFDPMTDNVKEKVKDLCNSLVGQIDTISNIAEAFSDFAKMPARKDVMIDWVEVIDLAIDIFPDQHVKLISNETTIHHKFDKGYLIRIINNLVKNAIQSVPDDRIPYVQITILKEFGKLSLSIADNGIGIQESQKEKVFQPKFTTKSSGMGLGLSMVRKIVLDYKGVIYFEPNTPFGTIFKIEFDLEA